MSGSMHRPGPAHRGAHSHSCDHSPTTRAGRSPQTPSSHAHYSFQWALAKYQDYLDTQIWTSDSAPNLDSCSSPPYKKVERTRFPFSSSREKGIKEGEVQVSQADVGKQDVQSRAQVGLTTTSAKANPKFIATAEIGHFFYYLSC